MGWKELIPDFETIREGVGMDWREEKCNKQKSSRSSFNNIYYLMTFVEVK